MTKNNQVVSVFGSMYADCVRSNKQLRQGLFKSLLSIFADNWDDKTLLNYVGSTCAHLPYLTVNEPLFCIRELSSIVAVEGGAVVDGLKGILGVETEDDGWLSEDELKELFAQDWTADKVADVTQLLDKGDAMVILLRLKYFLRRVYNLSDDKINEYNSVSTSASEASTKRRRGSMMTYKTLCSFTIMRVAGSATSAMRKPQILKRVRNDEA
jgi:hypothetical protein